MNYSIREMRKEEYSLLGDFLYEAIYIPDGTDILMIILHRLQRLSLKRTGVWESELHYSRK